MNTNNNCLPAYTHPESEIARKKERDLLIDAYPEWEKNIRCGDFYVREESGKKMAVWANTNIFRPTPKQLDMVLGREFGSFRSDEVEIHAQLMALVIIGKRL